MSYLMYDCHSKLCYLTFIVRCFLQILQKMRNLLVTISCLNSHTLCVLAGILNFNDQN